MKENTYQQQHGAIASVEELNEVMVLTRREVRNIEEIVEYHPMAVTPHYLSLIRPDDPDDPIKKMAIPSVQEKNLDGCFDTSGEKVNTKIQGLQHKYTQTALVLITNQCAMYCRHCFRKRMVGVAQGEIAQDWPAIFDYIDRHEEINNVLLSGGDALTVDTARLESILSRLADMPHLNYIRIGSRIPVVQPCRINDDDELIEVFRHYSASKQIYVTTQFNHPLEISEESVEAVRRLQSAGVVVNNQAVLLKDVNDEPVVLAELMRALTRIGVVPYYVFQCRPVSRVKDAFQIPLLQAIDIIDNARKRLDGLAKRFRFALSHKAGKIEILGRQGNQMFFKYHQAKDKTMISKVFTRIMDDGDGWLYGDEEGDDDTPPCQE